MTSSSKCHQGPCGPCFLCRSRSMKYTHPDKFDSDQYDFLCEVEGTVIDKCVCTCYACSKQLTRHVDCPKFEPRWQEKNTRTENKCSVQSCTNIGNKNTTLATGHEIEGLLGQPIVSFTTVCLCQVHYNSLYSKLNASAPCMRGQASERWEG